MLAPGDEDLAINATWLLVAGDIPIVMNRCSWSPVQLPLDRIEVASGCPAAVVPIVLDPQRGVIELCTQRLVRRWQGLLGLKAENLWPIVVNENEPGPVPGDTEVRIEAESEK